jgi:hypothetical protein
LALADDDEDADGEDDVYSTSSGDSASEPESDSEVEAVQQTNGSDDVEDDTPQGAEIEIEGDFEYVRHFHCR